MKKIYIKLSASILSILIACTMIVGATYAWLTLSTSPVASAISMTIGGGKTIMLAADITETVIDAEGNQITVHYPGKFSNTLNFSKYESYDYLNELSGLSPVSTADGVYWMIPTYEEETGKINDISDFQVDKALENANVTKTETGSYIYIDFWMVSPGTDYNIRVSTDTMTNTGSYLIELPGVEKSENGNLQLAKTQEIAESIARIGFLVNTDSAGLEDMDAYRSSEEYNSQYTKLLGIYAEKGQEADMKKGYQFTIYEPNGTSHPSEELREGEYIITKPLDYNPYGNTIMEADISSKLMIQNENTWRMLNSSSQFEQIFETAIVNKENLTTEEAADLFYNEYLQGQVGAYVKCGDFYKSTSNLYALAENDAVSAEALMGQSAGAVDDVMITKLQTNTPQRVRMYIWLEGQDIDCTNITSVTASGLSVNIELSGADQ